LRVLFQARRKTGRVDLEAMELVVRSAMHRAGAAALAELLRFPTPAADQRTVPCACVHPAHYRELRSKPLLTAVGKAEVSRPYYLVSAGIKEQHFCRFCSPRVPPQWRRRGMHST
jgi:hypothetical protein